MRLEIDIDTIRTGGITGLKAELTRINRFTFGPDNLRPTGMENLNYHATPSSFVYLCWRPILHSANGQTTARLRDRLNVPQIRGVTALLCDKLAAIPMLGSTVAGNPSLRLRHVSAAGAATTLATINGMTVDQETSATFADQLVRPGESLELHATTSAGADVFNRIAVRVRLRCAFVE